MYKPTAWRSKGGLHVPTTQNKQGNQGTPFYRALGVCHYWRLNIKADLPKPWYIQTTLTEHMLFPGSRRETNLKSIYSVWQSIAFTVLALAKAEKDCSWDRQHDLQDTSILGRQKQLLISELQQWMTWTCEPAEPYQNSMHCVTRVLSPAYAQLPKGFPRSAGFETDSVHHLWCKSSHNFCQ